GAPVAPYHAMSPRQKVLRPSDGWALRKAIIRLKKRNTSALVSSRSQSSQVVSLSWLYGLLLPPCVFMNSSPATNMGVPLESINSAQKFFTWRLRSASTSAGAPSSPSQPQFQL